MSAKPGLGKTVSQMNRDDFVRSFADLYEHSPWVAEQTYDQGLSEAENDIEQLHQRFSKTVLQADKELQLSLIRAHPDLAGKAAVRGELTEASTSEQAGAGIQDCTPEEFERFSQLNDQYKARFEFPFIMAVKGSNRFQILDAFVERLENSYQQEFERALNEINKIAWFRLQDL